jgi:hypothetical protein
VALSFKFLQDHLFTPPLGALKGDLYRRGANDILMRCITQEEGHELLMRSMEESAEVIHHPAHWSVRPSGMAFIGQPLSRMQLRW